MIESVLKILLTNLTKQGINAKIPHNSHVPDYVMQSLQEFSYEEQGARREDIEPRQELLELAGCSSAGAAQVQCTEAG